MTHALLPPLLLASLCLLAGCTGTPHTPAAPARYTYVVLTSGPNSGKGTPDERKAMFAGHMSNINRLAQSRELLIAGPFDKPADPARRGIFILDTPTREAARALVASDPGVVSGEFTPVLTPMHGSPALRRALDLYNEQQAAKASAPAAPTDAAKPPEDMRRYVLVECRDAARVRAALDTARIAIVWSGTFTDDHAGGGVFVLDSTDPAAARAALAGAGHFEADGWWSTSALLGLRMGR